MYVQITTACNMRCAHCCYDTSYSGEYMSSDVFDAALKLPRTRCTVDIGGGEPTIHPNFWEFIDKAQKSNYETVWIVTNGKKTTDALKLAYLAKIGKIECGLSQDKWHENISERVVESFTIPKTSINDKRFIINIGKYHEPIRHGRCDWSNRISCNVSNKPFVSVDGNIHQCGCDGSPIVGDVFNGFPKETKWKCYRGLGDPNRDPRTKVA